jgi:hypothetical protein
MGRSKLNTVIGYSVATITMAMGIGVLTGWFFPEGTPVQLRWTFGIVLVLLSVYRAIATYTKNHNARLTNTPE